MNKKLPSEEEILAFIKEGTTTATKREIARAFSIKGVEARSELKKILKKLVKSGSIVRNAKKAYELPNSLPHVLTVKFLGIDYDRNMWIAEPEKWNGKSRAPRIFVKPKRQVKNPSSTRALIRVKKISNKEYLGHIIKHFDSKKDKKQNEEIIGVITLLSDKSAVLTPATRERNASIQIKENNLNGAKSGDLVIAKRINRYDVKVSKILGKEDDPNLLSLIAIYQHNIPHKFPEDVVKATEKMTLPNKDEKREDLQKIPLVTIDGKDAKDFDDAVFAEPCNKEKNKGAIWHIIVAIADVSYYVRPNTELDKEALKRGNSTYFPDRVVPMLPEKLSNDLCSLRPNQLRASLAVHLWIDEESNLLNYKFTRAIIKSKARLTYEEVEEAIKGNPNSKIKSIKEHIDNLYKAYKTLKKSRNSRGALDIELPEYQVNINRNTGKIESISKRVRLESHQLIEEFMVLANIATAKALEKHEKTSSAIYRIHPEPDAAKISEVHNFLNSLGHRFKKQVKYSTKDINNILNKVRNLDIAHLTNTIILRCQSKAIYHTENRGHFGLALSHYTHFTSPIRRYADLLVHRALVKIFKLGTGGQSENEVSKMQDISEHISETERRSMMAERSAMDRYTALYLKEQSGAEFTATISGVNKAGIFISLDNCGSDGFIPARTLPKDYYIHDDKKHALVGKRTKREFRLCASVTAKLIEADPVAGSTIFNLIEYEGKKIPSQSTKNKNRFNKAKKTKSKKQKK